MKRFLAIPNRDPWATAAIPAIHPVVHRSNPLVALPLVALLLLASFATAPLGVAAAPQDSTTADEPSEPDWDQQWSGVLEVGQVELRLRLDVRETEEGWTGQLISLDQNNAVMPLSEFVVVENVMEFATSIAGISFRGELDDEKRTVEGTFRQGGGELPLKMERLEADTAPTLEAAWTGKMKAGPQEFEFLFRQMVDKDGKRFIELDSLTEGIKGLYGELALDGNSVRVEFSAVAAVYEGELSEDGQSIEGIWTQSGMEFPLQLTKTSSEEIKEPETLEVWAGSLDAGIRKIRLQFHVVRNADESVTSALDDLTNGAEGIPGTYQKEGQQVTYKWESLNIEFIGELDEAGARVEGTFKQGRVELPLTLERIEEPESLENTLTPRPQTPEPPFPYDVVEVEVPNDSDNLQLGGTLVIPPGEGPYPCAILVSGSGPQDRDETISRHKPFFVIADHLVRHGIAVLRYDDRGIGKSTGQFETATSADFSRDAEACLEFLLTQDRIDPERIGIIGHSEGGLIAPMVAARRDDLDFIVLLAGPGVTGEEIVYAQTRLIAEAGGADEHDLAFQDRLVKQMLELAMKSDSEENFSEEVKEILDATIASADEATREEIETNRELILSNASQFNTPWFRFFLKHDPAPVLEQVHCPVLALNGEKDLQVPSGVNLEAIKAALTAAGNEQFELVALPDLNHLFQHSDTGSPTEYDSIEETFDVETLRQITNWIHELD